MRKFGILTICLCALFFALSSLSSAWGSIPPSTHPDPYAYQEMYKGKGLEKYNRHLQTLANLAKKLQKAINRTEKAVVEIENDPATMTNQERVNEAREKVKDIFQIAREKWDEALRHIGLNNTEVLLAYATSSEAFSLAKERASLSPRKMEGIILLEKVANLTQAVRDLLQQKEAEFLSRLTLQQKEE